MYLLLSFKLFFVIFGKILSYEDVYRLNCGVEFNKKKNLITKLRKTSLMNNHSTLHPLKFYWPLLNFPVQIWLRTRFSLIKTCLDRERHLLNFVRLPTWKSNKHLLLQTIKKIHQNIIFERIEIDWSSFSQINFQ